MPDQTPAPTPAPRRRLSWGGRFMWLAFMALFAVPLIRYGGRAEWDRWQAARAMEIYDKGDAVAAIQTLASICERPEVPNHLRTMLARWQVDHRQPAAALETLKPILDTLPPAAAEVSSLELAEVLKVQLIQIDALLQMKRRDEAVRVYRFREQARNRFFERGASANESAYLRARIGVDLAEAENDMEVFLKKLEMVALGRLQYQFTLRTKTLVSSGLLAWIDGDSPQILPSLSEEIERLQKTVKLRESDLFQETMLFLPELEVDVGKFNQRLLSPRRLAEFERQQCALMLLIRALLLDAQGAVERAQADRLQLREWGIDESDLLTRLPRREEALYWVESGAAYLDTLGWIQFRAGKSRLAIQNLNVAIVAAEFGVASSDTGVASGLSSSSWALRDKQVRQTLATLIKHRYEVAVAMKLRDLVETDAARIRELGFELDSPQLDQ